MIRQLSLSLPSGNEDEDPVDTYEFPAESYPKNDGKTLPDEFTAPIDQPMFAFAPRIHSRRVLGVLLSGPSDIAGYCSSQLLVLQIAWAPAIPLSRPSRHPLDIRPSFGLRPSSHRMIPIQSLDLEPDPLWLGWRTLDLWMDSCPLSADLAPDPGGRLDRPHDILSLTGTLQSVGRLFVLSGTDMIGFRCPPDPRVADNVAGGILPPGTAVLLFRRPPDP